MELSVYEQKVSLSNEIRNARKPFWTYSSLMLFCIVINVFSTGMVMAKYLGTRTTSEDLLYSYLIPQANLDILLAVLGVISFIGFIRFMTRMSYWDDKIFDTKFALNEVEEGIKSFTTKTQTPI